MRPTLLLALGLLVASGPVMAGTVSYADGRGSWQPAKCMMPPAPAPLARNAEAPANNLNEQISIHNAYVAAAQDYMNCISQEAQADAQGAGQVVTLSAQKIIQKVQADVANSGASMGRKAVVQPQD